MFTPSNMLLKYMNAQPRDIYDIVGALMGYINADPMFKTNDFDEAIQYVLSHGVSRQDLFDEFDPEIEMEEDQDKWDEEYYSYARVYLKDNFSEKRIQHVKAVARKLYPMVRTIQKPQQNAEVKPSQEQQMIRRATQGGQQTSGKKQRDQQGSSNLRTTGKEPVIAKIIGVVLFCALLVGLIVYIIR